MDAPVQAAEAPLRRESALRRVGCKRLSVTSIFRPAAWALNAIQIYPSSYHSGGTRIASETVLMHPKPRTEKRKRQLESDAASSPITSKTYQRVNRAAASKRLYCNTKSSKSLPPRKSARLQEIARPASTKTEEDCRRQLLSPPSSDSHKQPPRPKRKLSPSHDSSSKHYDQSRKRARVSQNTSDQLEDHQSTDYEQFREQRLSEHQPSIQALNEDPIEHWIRNACWPEDYAKSASAMDDQTSSSEKSKKRQRTSSYSQSVKDGTAPEQYTSTYEKWIEGKGLFMDVFRGEESVCKKSKELCVSLQKTTQKVISPSIFPKDTSLKVVQFCQNRNEGKVNRDVTPMIIPPTLSLYLHGDSAIEHVIDEVNADWMETCVLAGPQIRPDLSIGLSSSAFSEAEIDKMKNYASVDNWAMFTGDMYLPFLMCEVKCGRDGLNKADRQNMHSSSVAVRALLRIEQEADKHRQKKQFETLDGQILVFSISHDQQDARLYGHYAQVQGKRWEYHRYSVKKFDLRHHDELVAIHNFVRNVFKTFLPKHVKRIKDALAALPDPSTLSFSTSEMNLHETLQNSRDASTARDDGGFRVPDLPQSAIEQSGEQTKESKKREQQREQIDKLLQQMEQQRQDSKEKEERMERQMEQQREQIGRLLQLMEQQREDGK